MREYPSGDGAVLIKQLPLVRFQPLVLLYSSKKIQMKGLFYDRNKEGEYISDKDF